MTDPEDPYAAPRPADFVPPKPTRDSRRRLARWAGATGVVLVGACLLQLATEMQREADPAEVATLVVILSAHVGTAAGLFRVRAALLAPFEAEAVDDKLGGPAAFVARCVVIAVAASLPLILWTSHP